MGGRAARGHRRHSNGRSCGPFAQPPRATHGQARGAQVRPRRVPADPGLPLNAPKRPAQPPQRHDLLLLVVLKDVAHPYDGPQSRRRRQRLDRYSK